MGVIYKWLTNSYTNFGKIPFIFVLIVIELYFFINGEAHFPEWSSTYGNLITVYILMTLFFLLWSRRGVDQQIDRPFSQSIIWFVFFFIGTYVLMLFASIFGLFQTTSIPSSLFWPTVIIQVCVVATSEELMFRGVMLDWVGVIWSSVAFAVFHGWAYGMIYYQGQYSWGAMAFAFVMGLILAMIAKNKEWGLAATISIHGCYNLFITGAMAGFGG